MGNTTTLGNKSKFRELLDSFGLPRLIIACFLLLLLIAAPCVGLDFPTQITNIITRFSWNAVMVLAMVPMVHSGCGLNFGLPLGIVSGLLGATLSIELGYTGFASFLMAILIATPFALLFGGGYGWLLNKIKGGEMMIATYVGFSSVSFMCMMWLLLPYKHPTMVWGFSASGLRTVISLEGYYDKALANILTIDLNSIGINLVIPTGTLLFFVLLLFASLTSSVSILEIFVPNVMELSKGKINRKKSAVLGSALCMLLGIPVSFSFGIWGDVRIFGQDIFSLYDNFICKIAYPLIALCTAVLIAWIWGKKNAVNAITNGGTLDDRFSKVWFNTVKFVCPIFLMIVVLSGFGIIR